MDRNKIKNLWHKVIDEKEIENSNGELTYKNEEFTISTSSKLPVLSLSQSPTLDMSNISDTAKTMDSEVLSRLETMEDIDSTITHSSANLPAKKMEGSKKSDSHYELLGEIARGGMGVVFKGRQESLQREVAIKKILDQGNQTKQSKFISESLVTAYLDHPNIVPVHELAKNELDEVFLAMKLVGGTEWKKLLHPQNEKDKEAAKKYNTEGHLRILLSVCNAIACAHTKGIVHNDLKPSNVMVGEFGEVLVMDWGIAVDISEPPKNPPVAVHKTAIDSPMGTPNYMPRELAEGDGKNIGPWTDIYLLGSILYEVLMGKPPHVGNAMTAILASIKGDRPPFSESTPKELQQICHKAMALNPKDRYQRVADFTKAIENYLQHRESLLISGKACEILHESLALQKKQVQGNERNYLYSKFSKSVSGFEQALELWQDNQEALDGCEKAKFAYAKAALNNDDFGLALAQMETLPNSPEYAKIRKDIQQAQDKKLRMQKTTRQLRRVVYAAVLFIICGLVIGFILINNAYQNAQKQKQLAEEQKKEAEKQKEIAEQQTHIAQEQKKEAEKQKEIAEQQIHIVKEQKKEVERQKKIAEQNENEAKKARQETEKKNVQLANEKQIVQKQKDEIDEQKKNTMQSLCISLRMLKKVFFETKEAQKDPSIIQALKETFAQIKNLEMLDEIFASEPDALWLYGVIFNEIKTYSDLIEKEPKNYSAYYNRGCIYIEHELYDKAINDFSIALTLNPKLAEAYFNRGIIYLKRKEEIKAEQDFSSAISSDPSDAKYYYYRAYLYLQQNIPQKAEKDLLQCLKLEPEFAKAHEKIGIVYFHQSNYKTAFSHLQNAIKSEPKNKDAHYYLARIFAVKNDTQNALRHLSLALENKFSNFNDIKTNSDFNKIRQTKQFQQLLQIFVDKK